MVVPDAPRRRRDAGPSVALCGEMLGPQARCRAICGLVRRDARAEAADPGAILWPADGRLRKGLDMRCDHVSGGPLPRPGRFELSARVLRRESCELVNLRE